MDDFSREAFYCDQLGFTKCWEHKPESVQDRPAYLGLGRDGVCIHVSSFPGDGISGTVTNFVVADVDTLFAAFNEKGVKFLLEPYDQEWGVREMHLLDLDGNKLRFVQEK